MKKISFLIRIVAIIIFIWYSRILYHKYEIEQYQRKSIIEKNTQEIKESFLKRDKDFYLDLEYKKNLKNLKKKYEEQKWDE